MNERKTTMSGLVCVFVLFCFFLSEAHAFKGKVKNPTNYQVTLITVLQLAPKKVNTTVIQPGAEALIDTGANCPCGLGGFIDTGKVDDEDFPIYKDLKIQHCLGHDLTSWLGVSACCWNLNRSICPKQNQDNEEISDGDFGFCDYNDNKGE